MSDLERQIAAYAAQLDAAAPPVEELAPGDPIKDPHDVVEIGNRRQNPPWLWAAAAAAAVGVIVGSTALLGALRTPVDEDPTATTTTQITDTTTPDIPGPEVRETPVSLVSTDPVIGRATYDKIDMFRHFTMGDVVLSDGMFHTLLGAEGESPGLYHATSVDGSEWAVSQTPVELFGGDTIEKLRASALIPMPDGTWRGYFDVGRDLGGFGDHRWKWWIHVGTAPSPQGPWTIEEAPVIDEGAEGEWDGGWIRNASVIRQGDEWMMFYLGSLKITTEEGDRENPRGVGIATSSDGLIWTKIPEPVFVAIDDEFEDGQLAAIEVKLIDGGYLMTYAGRTGGNRGLAYSDDGIAWTRDERNPVLTTIEVPRASIYDTALVDDDGTLRWYAVAGGYAGAATYELLLDLDG